jgi:hypothetical protein
LATKTKPEPVKFKPFRVAVKFGQVGVGMERAGLSISVQLEDVSEEKGEDFDRSAAAGRAHKLFCSKQFRAILILGKREDDDAQKKLMATDIELEQIWNTARTSAGTKDVSFKISAARSELKSAGESTLNKFAGRQGYLKVLSLMEELDLGEDDEEEAEE